MATETTAVNIFTLPERDTTPVTRDLSKAKLLIEALDIQSDEEFHHAGQLLQYATQKEKEAGAFLADDIKAADSLHKSLTGKRSILMTPWTALKAMCSAKMSGWTKQKEALAAAHAKEVEAEQRRIKLEAEEDAKKLIVEGRVQEARVIREQAGVAVETIGAAVQHAASAPRVDGIRKTEVWSVDCTDPVALMKAVVDKRIPLMHEVRIKGKLVEEPLFLLNPRVLDAVAERHKEALTWPGCTVKKETKFGSTGR